MPTMLEHAQTNPCKLLGIGDSGEGKTGSLCALIDAGYKLRILDFDNGLDVLRHYVKDKGKLANVLFEDCTEELKMVGGKLKAAGPGARIQAFAHAMDCLDDWPVPEGHDTIGSVNDWDHDSILVIDSLTMMGKAAMKRVLSLKGDLSAQLSQPQWGEAQRMVEDVLMLLYSKSVRCNVIVFAHNKYIGGDDEGAGGKIYPDAPGKALSPSIPRFFNTMVLYETQGSGINKKKKIITKSTNKVALKVPCPIDDELPQETGLLTIFEAVRAAPSLDTE